MNVNVYNQFTILTLLKEKEKVLIKLMVFTIKVSGRSCVLNRMVLLPGRKKRFVKNLEGLWTKKTGFRWQEKQCK